MLIEFTARPFVLQGRETCVIGTRRRQKTVRRGVGVRAGGRRSNVLQRHGRTKPGLGYADRGCLVVGGDHVRDGLLSGLAVRRKCSRTRLGLGTFGRG
jgi:hypothetical protein